MKRGDSALETFPEGVEKVEFLGGISLGAQERTGSVCARNGATDRREAGQLERRDSELKKQKKGNVFLRVPQRRV